MEIQEQISKQAKKVLKEMTGEPRTALAVNIALKDTIRLKIEEIDKKSQDFEKKYKCDFATFEKNWKKNNDYSYEREKDFLKWDSLSTRKRHLLKLLKALD